MPTENGTTSETLRTVTRSKGGTHGRSRPRASLACMNCRQRKIKCDAQLKDANTTCTSCRSLNIVCIISRDGDRRKIGSREQVASLQDRIQLLESLMRQSFHQDIVMSDSQAFSSQLTLDSSISVNEPAPNFTSESAGHNIHEVSSSVAPQDLLPGRATDWDGLPSDHNNLLYGQPTPSPGGDPTQILDGIVEDHSSSTEIPLMDKSIESSRPDYRQNTPNTSTRHYGDHVANVLSQPYPSGSLQSHLERLTPPSEKDLSRLDIDGDYGQPRFYGPTSQPYIQCPEAQATSADVEDSIEADIGVKMDSSPLRTLLLNNFWKSQPLSIIIIHEELFTVNRLIGRRSQYYSTFLEHALLACATRMSTSDGVRKLGKEYAERAKSELTQELENPNIASLQGFLLLSDFEATRGRDRLGYIYSGISCRLLFDLGLHEDCTNLVTQGKLSATEATFRHILFLGTFVFDRLWSLYLGRPSSIPLPILFEAQRAAFSRGGSEATSLDAWVSLCTQMSEVIEILNSASPLDQKSVDHLFRLDTKIRDCFEALPPALTCNETEVSELNVNAYGLHVQFYGIRIVLHRLLSKASCQQRLSDGLVGTEPGSPRSTTLEHSRTIMYTNAIRIARLVSIYYQIFGIENVITVMLDNMFIAATVIISHILELQHQNSSTSTERDVQWLRLLADMMQKAQKHYHVAARMRFTLSSSVDGTSLAGIFGSGPGQLKVLHDPQAAPLGEAEGSSNPGDGLLPQTVREQHEHTELEGMFDEFGDRWFQETDLNDMMYWSLQSGTQEDIGGQTEIIR